MLKYKSWNVQVPSITEMIENKCVPDMLIELQTVALKVVSRVSLGVRRGVSQSFKLLHVRGGLHLYQIFPHGYQEVNLVCGKSVPF